jgi:hypothetical protein
VWAKNRSSSEGAAQDFARVGAVHCQFWPLFQSSIAGCGEEFLGLRSGLRSSPGYNAIAPSALKRTYLLRNRRVGINEGKQSQTFLNLAPLGQSSNIDRKSSLFTRTLAFASAPSQPIELLAHISGAFHPQSLRDPAQRCRRPLVDGICDCDLSMIATR